MNNYKLSRNYKLVLIKNENFLRYLKNVEDKISLKH